MIKTTIAKTELIDWWLRTQIDVVEIIDWWMKTTIAIIQKKIEYYKHERFAQENGTEHKMQRIKNKWCRSVMQFKLSIRNENCRGLVTNGDTSVILISMKKRLSRHLWKKWRLAGIVWQREKNPWRTSEKSMWTIHDPRQWSSREV